MPDSSQHARPTISISTWRSAPARDANILWQSCALRLVRRGR